MFLIIQILTYAYNLTTRTVEGKYKIIYGKAPVPPIATKNTKTETVDNNPYKTVSQENPKKYRRDGVCDQKWEEISS